MILLITGATHSGKTKLAQRLLEEYAAPYLSIDHLKMGLIRSGQTALTPEDDEALTGYLWPIVREIVKTAAENRQKLIVEGCYVPFDWRDDFEPELLADIRCVCLGLSDGYIEAHFDEIRAHASDVERRVEDGYCTPALLKLDNRLFLEGHRRSGTRCILVERDYAETLEAFVRSLKEELPTL